jgi:hypothetical protein
MEMRKVIIIVEGVKRFFEVRVCVEHGLVQD